MADKNVSQGVLDAQVLLLWCRSQGFAVSQIDAGDVKLTVSDIRIDPPAKEEPPPRSAHEAWARTLGVKLPTMPQPGDEDDEGEVAS